MKKYAFLVYHRQYTEFLEQLREAGVVHVAEKPEGIAENDQLRDKMQLSARIKKVVDETAKLLPEGTQAHASSAANGAELLEAFDQMQAEKQRLQQAITTTQKEAEQMQVWGNYDATQIAALAQAGYILQCWQCPISKYDGTWETDCNAVVIGQNGSNVQFVTIGKDKATLEADPVQLNDKNSTQLALDAEALNHLLVAQQGKMEAWSIANLNNLKAYAVQVSEAIDFQKVELCTTAEADEKVMLLEGYCPAENEDALNALLEQTGVYYESADVDKEDTQAPIKLKNNWFARMYEVLTSMYGMPDYAEFDPTPILAPFFSLFFGLCMGDAGYGLLIIALGWLAKKKMGPSMRGMMNLIITLGVFTTLCGALLGTFFGVDIAPMIAAPEWMKTFMPNHQTSLMGMTFDNAMLLALGIGIVHISIAMTVKAIGATVRYGFKESLSVWGWQLLVVGSVIVFSLLLLDIIPANVSQWLLIVIASVAAIAIYLLNNLHRNPLINIGAGLWDTYNMATGLLGDVLSYIRLYALGLAGGLLGGAFNTLGIMSRDGLASLGMGGVIAGWICFGLIVVIGHALNIALSCLSAFVHPLRLTFVEYFKNSGYEGQGVPYKPFTKQINN